MPEMSDISCEDCGAVFPMMVGGAERADQQSWHPGKKCPICGSDKFVPVVRKYGVEPKPLAKWKLDPRVGISAVAVAVLFLLIGFVWYLHERPHRTGGLKAVYVCGECGQRFVRSVSASVPQKCPECKSRAGYRAVQCLSCYEVYPWKAKDWAANPPTCPKCKSQASAILRHLADIRKKKEIPKKPDQETAEGQTDESE